MAMYGELVGEDLVFDPNPVEISELSEHEMVLVLQLASNQTNHQESVRIKESRDEHKFQHNTKSQEGSTSIKTNPIADFSPMLR